MLAQADRALYRSKEEGPQPVPFPQSDPRPGSRQPRDSRWRAPARHWRSRARAGVPTPVEIKTGKIIWHRGARALGITPPEASCHRPTSFRLRRRRARSCPSGTGCSTKPAGRSKPGAPRESLFPASQSISRSTSSTPAPPLIRDVTDTLEKMGASSRAIWNSTSPRPPSPSSSGPRNDVLPQLRDLGIQLAIDGFGSEYSSFDYIKEYRVNHLKIARSYVREGRHRCRARHRCSRDCALRPRHWHRSHRSGRRNRGAERAPQRNRRGTQARGFTLAVQ